MQNNLEAHMHFLKGSMAVTLSYLLVILPGCRQRNEQADESYTMSDSMQKDELTALKKKNPSELQAMMLQLKGKMVESFSNSRIKMIYPNGDLVTQAQIDANQA